MTPAHQLDSPSAEKAQPAEHRWTNRAGAEFDPARQVLRRRQGKLAGHLTGAQSSSGGNAVREEARRVWEGREETARNFIKTKWADTNKGTSECPNVRSRWVAREYKQYLTQTRLVQRNILWRV